MNIRHEPSSRVDEATPYQDPDSSPTPSKPTRNHEHHRPSPPRSPSTLSPSPVHPHAQQSTNTHALTAPLRRCHPRPLHNANKGPILRLRALANRLQRLRRWMGTTRRAGRHPRYDRLRRARGDPHFGAGCIGHFVPSGCWDCSSPFHPSSLYAIRQD